MWNRIDHPHLGPVDTALETIGGYRTRLFAAGEGAPVVLLHGASVAVDAVLTWFRLFPELARSQRVVMLDHPGFGDSEGPSDGSYLDRLARARHAAAVLDALALGPATLVGHSEGGFMALWLAASRPELVRSALVVTSGGSSPMLDDERDEAWMAASARAYDYLGRTRDEQTFVRTEQEGRRRPDPEFDAILLQNFRRDLAGGHVEMFRRRARQAPTYARYTALQEEHLFPILQRIRCPVDLVWGEADFTVPVARGQLLQALVPGARFTTVPGAGHYVMHDAPDHFRDSVAEHLRRSS